MCQRVATVPCQPSQPCAAPGPQAGACGLGTERQRGWGACPATSRAHQPLGGGAAEGYAQGGHGHETGSRGRGARVKSGFIFPILSVHYRDIPQILGHFLTFWFFLSPIVYPATQVPESYRFILLLNPFAPFVVAYQDIFLYSVYPSPRVCGEMIGISLGILLCGLCVFTHFRWSFAEEI